MKHLKLFEGYIKKYGILDVSNSNLTSLSELPIGIKILECYGNKLTSLPKLPEGLTDLDCSNNNITTLPVLPDSLEYLSCDLNPLESLIPSKFLKNQFTHWLNEEYYPFIKSYKGQKKILTERPDQVKELKEQVVINHLIKKEFPHLFTGTDLNLL